MRSIQREVEEVDDIGYTTPHSDTKPSAIVDKEKGYSNSVISSPDRHKHYGSKFGQRIGLVVFVAVRYWREQ